MIFRGRLEDVAGSDLRATAQRLLDDRLDEMYPQLSQFTASLKRDDVMHVLRTTDLGALHAGLRDGGIGLVEATPSGWVLVTDRGPLAALVSAVQTRASYGYEATGGHLTSHFAKPPFGAQIEVIQALCAAAMRAGIVEAVHQGQRISDADDRRLDQVFGTIPAFRAAAFRNPTDANVPIDERIDLAKKLETFGAHVTGHSTGALAQVVRREFGPLRAPVDRVTSTLKGVGIAVPEPVTRTQAILDRITAEDDVEVVTTARATWSDLTAGLEAVTTLDGFLAQHTDDLRAAQLEGSRSAETYPEEFRKVHADLRDLLADADLAVHAITAIALANRLRDAREQAARAAADRLNNVLDKIRSRLRGEFSDLDEGALAEVLRAIDSLKPPDDLSTLAAPELKGRIDTANARAGDARRQLEELRTAGRLSWIRVSELITGPISAEDEIEPALERIRDAVAGELADGKQVRLL